MTRTPFICCNQVYFGNGAVSDLGTVVQRFGAGRVLVVTDRGVRNAGTLGEPLSALQRSGIGYAVFDDIKPEPNEGTVDALVAAVRDEKIDAVVGIGGGSVLDCAKVAAILLSRGGRLRDYLGQGKVAGYGLPLILVPTTSGTGSESTPNALFIVDGEKQAVISPYLVPKVAVIDPVVTATAPPHVTAAAGVDALVHACESFTSLKSTSLTEMYSLRAAELIARSIRTAVWQGIDMAAREDMALGSYLAGIAIANAGTGAVHALAYPLGSKYGLSHGISNSVMFLYVSEANIPAAIQKFAILARALGAKTTDMSRREAAYAYVDEIMSIIRDVGLPLSLAEFGVEPSDIHELVTDAMKQTRLLNNNPRVLAQEDIEKIYRHALSGEGCRH